MHFVIRSFYFSCYNCFIRFLPRVYNFDVRFFLFVYFGFPICFPTLDGALRPRLRVEIIRGGYHD